VGLTVVWRPFRARAILGVPTPQGIGRRGAMPWAKFQRPVGPTEVNDGRRGRLVWSMPTEDWTQTGTVRWVRTAHWPRCPGL
jgi:hypothetical protein